MVKPNFVQTAFAQGNQNVTFFVLGLAVTALGALLALAQPRRSRSRIQGDLVALDELEKEARSDPAEARRDLADYERELRRRLADGRLPDLQYGILERRIRDVERVLAG